MPEVLRCVVLRKPCFATSGPAYSGTRRGVRAKRSFRKVRAGAELRHGESPQVLLATSSRRQRSGNDPGASRALAAFLPPRHPFIRIAPAGIIPA
jgi:hypothetical protein